MTSKHKYHTILRLRTKVLNSRGGSIYVNLLSGLSSTRFAAEDCQ
jgi:hypothetical protein